MLKFIETQASVEELVAIFESNLDRNIFISEYPYFGLDGNDAFYINFIDTHMSSSKYKAREDAIELSIVTNTFKGQYLDAIKEIIYSRRTELIKLLCIDWLFHFFKNLPHDIYLEINEFALKKSKYDLIKVQCMLNLFLLIDNYSIMENLIPCLNETKHAATFYRAVNGLNAIVSTKEISNEVKSKILNSININNILHKDQKARLIELFNQVD